MSNRRLDLKSDRSLTAAGAYDAISAKLIEKAQFDLMFVTGYGVSGSHLGLPDAGFLDFSQNLAVTRNIVRSTSIPVLADVDTAYGGVTNVLHTVREFELIGASGVMIEDQVFPKRCPQIVTTLKTISLNEATAKIKAAVGARKDEGFAIVARTDTSGDEVYRRADAFAEAGADMVVPISRAFETADEFLRFIEQSPIPVCINISGRMADILTFDELANAGCKIVNFPLVPLYAAFEGMKSSLEELSRTRDIKRVARDTKEDFEEVVGVKQLAELEAQYDLISK